MRPEPIAIVGLGCRLGGGINTPAQFWQFLLAGGSAVAEVPAERWETYLQRDPRNAAVLRDTTRLGTFLDDLAGFDAEFFGVSPREAELMDPQQRLAVEVCWEALEHAGVPPRSLAGSDTAVLMGVNSDDYGKLLMEDLAGIEAWTGIGTSLCGVANRVSHLLDLHGPSVALDAACAASLVAVHQGCQLLRDGESSLVLAGGVSALIGPGLTRVLDVAGATAPDGRCKTFDAAADGYGRGEGAAVVVLKRLCDAQRDGDRVLAVVRGGAVAQDGRTVGIMSPNGRAQADLFRLACSVAEVPPASVGYIEAHGTGTPTGDPVELQALSEVYGAARDGGRCAVGSVKPNTGHLEGGAGAVGLMKAVLALQHGVIPPTAGVRTLTPALDWPNSGLRVPVVGEDWPRPAAAPRRAAVCSYGYGGTIAHLLVEEAPEPPKACTASPDTAALQSFPISARSHERLAEQARALASAAAGPGLAEVASTLWTRRSHEPARAVVLAGERADLMAGLAAVADGTRSPRVVTGEVLPGAEAGAVWVFSGHGSHWPGMGRELLCGEPAFGGVIDAVEPIFQTELGFSPRAALAAGELGGTDRVQALTFAMQAGLAAVLRQRGVQPAAVIGHSVGEVAACVVSGVFTLEQGAAVACYRARGFRSVAGQGAMALVGLSIAQARRHLEGRGEVVAAISASPQSTVVSGTADAVEQICRQWSTEGVSVRRVATDVAFHSPAMDPLTGELARLVAALAPARQARVPLYTTALSDPRSTALRDGGYWATNLRGRVRFAEAVTAAAEDGHRVFLEVSAHPVVSHSLAETLLHHGVEQHAAIPLLRRDQPELQCIATAIAALHCHGVPVEVTPAPWAPDLPGTRWRHRRFWRTPTPPPNATGLHDISTHTLLGGCVEVTGAVPARMWQSRLDLTTRPYPGDHPVSGTEIVPAAVLLNTFLTAAGEDLADVRLRTPVAPGQARDIQVVSQDGALTLSSRPAGAQGWLTHSTATVAQAESPDLAFDDSAWERCADELAPAHIVDTLAALGVAAMGFGWRITDLRRNTGEMVARVAAEPDGSQPRSWASLLDAATSAASVIFPGPPRLRMPARIERVSILGAPPAIAQLHIVGHPDATRTDVTIADGSGTVLAHLRGMTFEELENSAGGDPARLIHRVQWLPVDLPPHRPAEFVLLGDADLAATVAGQLADAGLPHRYCTQLPDDLGADTVVLALPRPSQPGAEQFVLRLLQQLHGRSSPARLWALTQGVHEGDGHAHAPLWGLARIAAAEHPTLFGGVLDLSDNRIPLQAFVLRGHPVLVARDGVVYSARLAAAGAGADTPMLCSPGGTYLITGATGALGLRIAQRLADLGARRLVLVSRTGLPARELWDTADAAPRTVAALEERGVTVHAVAVDIGAPDAVDVLRARLRALPPVRGVIHAAGVEAGALLMNTTAEDIAAAMHPKVGGLLTLHELFPPKHLDWMVLYSSCGYLAGFPGQGAYACGNAFLDAFARYRRGLGDRTTAVAWTAWRGMGMGSASGFVAVQLQGLGMGTVSADEAMRALDLAMRLDDANVVVLPVLPDAAAVPMLAGVAPSAADEPASAAVGDIVARDTQWVAEQVLEAVAAELGLSTDGVDRRLPLIEIGVDSIMTVALRRQLEKQTGLTLPPTLLWEHPTVDAVTARIVELLDA